MKNNDEGMILALSSPSGAGKTTITKKIQQKYQNFKISVSHTTRKPRSNEVEGIDYFFISKDEFKKKEIAGDFYESAKTFENYYGTSKKKIKLLQEYKHDILLDIDWQGTQQLSKYKELRITKVFILPPNREEIKKRLINRSEDKKKESISLRLKSYENDIKHWKDYDYILINDNLDICFKQIEKIINSNKKKEIV